MISIYYDRCISRGVLGSIAPVVYNNGTEIVQGPGYVAIRYEMIHETRIIPLDGRPPLSQPIRQLHGRLARPLGGRHAGRGDHELQRHDRRDGERPRAADSDALKMIERFTRIDADTIQYEATVDDPKTWTGRGACRFRCNASDGYGFFEYACHEGNNAMRNILSAARASERR